MTFDAFTTKYNGKYIDYDGKFGAQCVDLFLQYLKEVIGIDPRPFQGWGTAKNIFNSFDKIKDNHFKKILNTPTGVPQKGDILFWGTYPLVTGWAGHVAVFGSGDANNIISFDQNYPTNSPCHFYKHSYKGVMGWLTPGK